MAGCDAAGQPFPDRKAFAAGSGAGRFSGLWGYAGDIPWKIGLHFDSQSAGPSDQVLTPR